MCKKNADLFKVKIARLVLIVKKVLCIPLELLRSLFFRNIRTVPVLSIVRELRGKMSQLT